MMRGDLTGHLSRCVTSLCNRVHNLALVCGSRWGTGPQEGVGKMMRSLQDHRLRSRWMLFLEFGMPTLPF